MILMYLQVWLSHSYTVATRIHAGALEGALNRACGFGTLACLGTRIFFVVTRGVTGLACLLWVVVVFAYRDMASSYTLYGMGEWAVRYPASYSN